MPDDSGNLTPDEVTKATDWLNKVAEKRPQPCPVCGDTDWRVMNTLVQPIALGKQYGYNFGLPSFPLLVVVSLKCGYTRFVNAVIAGVVPLPDADPGTTRGPTS